MNVTGGIYEKYLNEHDKMKTTVNEHSITYNDDDHINCG
jgi:hypothetical protein